MSIRQRLLTTLAIALLFVMLAPSWVAACGGFFCTTIPVDQAAEQIIFTMDEGKIGTYVQINYSGSPDNFAWVLPVPSVPTIAQADIATFRDLNRMTTPLFIPPPVPDCLRRPVPMAAAAEARSDGVSVLASGVVGPFGYHVVDSDDPQEMVTWLRDNGYRIDTEMEPLIKVYVDEDMPLLAMKLQPGRETRDITPVKLEYESTQPMIPLRLTAVAAQQNMGVLVWVFASGRTAPVNYVDMFISDGEVLFSPLGQNNYRQVVAQAADQAGGRAFVTEFAGPTSSLQPIDPTAQLLAAKYPYLTRFYTRISPEEMTVDPVFDYAPEKGAVNNVHDLSQLPSPFDCTDDPGTFKPIPGAGVAPPMAEGYRMLQRIESSGAPRGGLLALVIGGLGLAALRWKPRKSLDGRRERGAGQEGLVRRVGAALRRLVPRLTPQAARLLLLEAILIQGVHELEHVVQVVQRYVLDIKLGAGVFGSVFDIEPVHVAYNATFLALLGLAYAGCRRSGAVPRNRDLVLGLLGVALLAQSYHSIEHVVKLVQFLETGRNGVPGILGQWISVVWLHFWFNTLIYIPVVAAFFVGGFHHALGRDLAALLPRRWAMVAVSLLKTHLS